MQNVIFITDIFIFNVPAEPQINAGTITLLLKKRKGNHMNIVFMNGGLGNQTFQYIYLRYLELQTGQPCIIDDSPFWGSDVPHNGYELEKVFHIHHQRMSELFDADVWNYMVSQRNSVAGIAQELSDGGMPLCMVYDTPNYRFNGTAYWAENIPDHALDHFQNIYYHGYWLGNRYYIDFENIIRKELVFPLLVTNQNAMQYLIQVKNSVCPVCIHIRRGDMVACGWCPEPEYYADSIGTFSAAHPHADFFLFSDDPDWCIAHQKELGLNALHEHVHYITGNTSENSWMDLSIMSNCHYFIVGRSSFSLLAWMLCDFPEKELITSWQI